MMPANILVIDGIETDRLFIEKSLYGEGYGVFSAPTGIDGLKILAQKVINLVIVDPNSLDEFGIDILEDIREHIRERSYKPEIVVVTQVESFQFAQEALRNKVADYVIKPFDIEQLLRTVGAVLHQVYWPGKENILSDLEESTGEDDDVFYKEAYEKEGQYINHYVHLIPEIGKMPQRPRSHILETESFHFVRGVLPFSWTIQEMNLDYGIDLRVEVFLGERATGLEFNMQVKATDHLIIRKNQVSLNIAVKTLVYLNSLENPSMLVLYDAKQKIGYWVWIKDYIEKRLNRNNPEWKNNSSIRLKFPIDNVFTYKYIDDIVLFLILHRLSRQQDLHKQIEAVFELHYSSGFLRDRLKTWKSNVLVDRIEEYLLTADVRDEILSKNEDKDSLYSHTIEVLIKSFGNLQNAALDYSRRAAYINIENNWLHHARSYIELICQYDPQMCLELSIALWEKWAEAPDLEAAVYSLVDFLPQDFSCMKYVRLVLGELKKRFSQEINKEVIKENIKLYNDIPFASTRDATEFLPWLMDIAGTHCSQAKILIDWLDYDFDVKETIFAWLEESEAFMKEETSH